MKFICTQNDLNTQLSLVSRAVASRPSHPILANILFKADVERQQVTLTGFDLSLGIQTSFSAQVESEGSITLPSKLLSDIVARLPEGSLSVDNEDDDLTVILTCSSGRYQVRGMAADDFPALPLLNESSQAHLPVESLIEGLRGSLFATSSDESKQVLTGVHVTAESEGLEFAATDGHRLAVVQTISPSDKVDAAVESTFDVTVPGKALRELERMLQLPGATETIAVRFDQGQLAVEWEHCRLTSRLLDGQYPNYRQLIPKQFSVQMTIERRAFIGALERIAVLATQKNSIVKMDLDQANQELVVSVDAPDVGSAREVVSAQISGDDLEVAFNVVYLLDGLKVLNSSEVQMQFNTSTSPAIFSPLGGAKMTYLVMPVQIRGN
jgi:DNA polymerase-3 subunit beta